MMAAQDGCHSLGKVLEPHFPLVQAKGRTQRPGSLIAETKNSCQVVKSRPGALAYGSAAAGEGPFPSGWARPRLLSNEVLCSSPGAVLLASRMAPEFPCGTARGWCVGIPHFSPRKAKQCHELEGPGRRSCPPPCCLGASYSLVMALPLYREPTGTTA